MSTGDEQDDASQGAGQDADRMRRSGEPLHPSVDAALDALAQALLAQGASARPEDQEGLVGLPKRLKIIRTFIDTEQRALMAADAENASASAVASEVQDAAPSGDLPAAPAIPVFTPSDPAHSSALQAPDKSAAESDGPDEAGSLIPPVPQILEQGPVPFQFQEFHSPNQPVSPAPVPPASPCPPSPARTAPGLKSAAEPALSQTCAPGAPQLGGVPGLPGRIAPPQASHHAPPEPLKKVIHLKNARAAEPYSGVIEVPGIHGLTLLEDAGTQLRLNQETGLLEGRPQTSGDFVLRLQGAIGDRRCEVVAHLAVIPDPRSLWVAKDSDRKAPFWKPDENTGRSSGDLLCVAASKRGRSHARDGTFRDDDFALWTGGPGGWNIAVVADGAGSAKFSRRGSQIAVDTIVKELPRLLDEHLSEHVDRLSSDFLGHVEGAKARIVNQLYLALGTAAFSAAKAIASEAELIEERVSAFSTTLVMSVARKGPHGWFIAGFAIGDGGAAIFDLPSRTVVPLTLADSGEFAGQTRFLQRSEFAGGFEDLSKRLFFDVRDSFTAILAMTDGITDPKFPTDVAFVDPTVWLDFWQNDLSREVRLNRENAALGPDLLAWLDFWSPGNHDDRTLAIMLP